MTLNFSKLWVVILTSDFVYSNHSFFIFFNFFFEGINIVIPINIILNEIKTPTKIAHPFQFVFSLRSKKAYPRSYDEFFKAIPT